MQNENTKLGSLGKNRALIMQHQEPYTYNSQRIIIARYNVRFKRKLIKINKICNNEYY